MSAVPWPAAGTTLLFCHGLAVSMVVLPLLALEKGLGASVVGLLVALSGAGQIGLRIAVARWAHKLTEQTLILGSVVLLAASSVAVLARPALWVFVVAHLAQGAARGFFWIGAQSHVVRSVPEPRRQLAYVDFAGGLGLVAGPATIGLAGGSLSATLVAGTVTTALSALPLRWLRRLPLPPPPAPESARAAVWRRPALRAPVLAAITTGTWRGMVGSYVPVVLAVAGYSATAVGLLVGLGSATAIAGSMLAGLAAARLLGPLAVVAAGAVGAGLAGTGLWPRPLALAVVLIALAGLGAGVLQTLSTSQAASAVHPDERGRVVAQIGTYRAVALLTSPLGIVALLPVVPLGPAMAVVGTVAAVPALRRWVR